MLKFSLCDYSDAHILVKGRIIITTAENDAVERQAYKRKKSCNIQKFSSIY